MRKIYLILATITLASCAGGAGPIDAQKLLSGMEGPKVPTVEDTLTESARNAEKSGDFKQAAQFYGQILDKSPDNKDALLGMAESYRRSGDYDKALQLYDMLLAKDAKSLDAREGKGLTLLAKGDFDEPGPIFEGIMKEDGKRWKTLNALGILFITRSMQKEAQLYFQEALKYNPNSASITNNIGLSQALERQYDTALGSLKQAAALTPPASPQRKRVDLNMALVYAISGKMDEARAITETYYSGAALNNNMGLYAHLAKDDRLAKAYLNMAVTESKTFYPKAWDNLQAIDQGSASAQDSKQSATAHTPAAELKPSAPAPEPKKKKTPSKKPSAPKAADDDISKIVNGDPKPAAAE